MTDEPRKTGSWGKPSTATDRQDHSERGYHLLSNLLTLLLTGIIIAGGFLLPTLLYPYLDFYHNDTVQLARPSESTIAEHIFAEPVTLYPWNLYDEDRLRLLSSTERELLETKGIPSFIVATLRDHGLSANPDESSYRAQIISSFRYLEPRDAIEPGCFVLVDADIDGDERADLRCAVDPAGSIISLLLISERWDSVQIEAPIGVAVAPLEGDETPGETMAEAQDEQTALEGGGEGKNAEAEGGEANAGSTGAEGAAGTEGTEGAESEGAESGITGTETTTETGIAQPVVEYLPVEEDQYLWSFAYATSREAKAINQQELFFAFRQLELSYEYRYSYPFITLLPLQPAKPEELPEIAYTPLTPTVFATGEYLLYIYELPSDERLILYLNPNTLRCKGFNLMRY
jgi:hypothetical protein